MTFVLTFLGLCATFTVVPYAVGILSLGRNAEFMETYSWGAMLVAGFSLLMLHAVKIAIAASGM
jgi:hypothetical protein